MTQATMNRVAASRILALGTLLAALMAAFVMLATSQAHASTTFTVNSTADNADALLTGDVCDTGYKVPGPGGAMVAECTLRAAINQANYTAGADTINFAIPGTSMKTIAPTTALPEITQTVTINGYTQPGSRANTRAVGNDAVLKIELSGANAGHSDGLWITASNSTAKGLVVNRWGKAGIYISGSGATGNKVTGNYLGTDATGTKDLGNSQNGVFIERAPNNTVGGATIGERNVISGNGYDGVQISGSAASGNKVVGNYLGTDNNGTADLGNQNGVMIKGAPNNTVGGTQAGERNIVSHNQYGVTIEQDATGNRVMQNVISANDETGVALIVEGDTGNRILSNSIFANGLLGIDLYADGPTANDPGYTDMGPNGFQNKPVLSSAKKSSTGTTTVKGNLNSTSNKTFNVQLFSNPKGTDEGKTLLGSKSVTTNGTGNASFNFSTKKAIRLGQNITATATNTSSGDTSEFSAPRRVVAQ